MSDSLRPHESQHARPPCPSPTPGVYSNSCPLSRWYHPAISSSVVAFSACPQSLPASGSFPVSQLFTWGGQSIGVSASASVLPMNTQDWSPLGWTGWISLQSKGLSRVFYSTTVGPRQLDHLEGHVVLPTREDSNHSKKGCLKVLTKVVPHIWKCMRVMLVVTVMGQVEWQGKRYWNLVSWEQGC